MGHLRKHKCSGKSIFQSAMVTKVNNTIGRIARRVAELAKWWTMQSSCTCKAIVCRWCTSGHDHAQFEGGNSMQAGQKYHLMQGKCRCSSQNLSRAACCAGGPVNKCTRDSKGRLMEGLRGGRQHIWSTGHMQSVRTSLSKPSGLYEDPKRLKGWPSLDTRNLT